jgi:hypothetical protein
MISRTRNKKHTTLREKTLPMDDTTCPECGCIDDGGGHVCAPHVDLRAELEDMKRVQQEWTEHVAFLGDIVARQNNLIGHIVAHLHMKIDSGADDLGDDYQVAAEGAPLGANPEEIQEEDAPEGAGPEEIEEEDEEDPEEIEEEQARPAKKRKVDEANAPMRFVKEVLLPLCNDDRQMFISIPNFRKRYNKWAITHDYEVAIMRTIGDYLVAKIPNFRRKRIDHFRGFSFSRRDILSVLPTRRVVLTSAGEPIVNAAALTSHQSVAMFVKKEWIDSEVSFEDIKFKTMHKGYIEWCRRNGIKPMEHSAWFGRILHTLFPTACEIKLGYANSRLLSFDHERGAAEYAQLNY